MNRRYEALPLLALILQIAFTARLFGGSTHAHRGTAVVDGVNGTLEWEGAEFGSATLVLPAGLGGGATRVTFFVMNDDDYIYAALQFPYPSSPAAPAFLDFAARFWADGTNPCDAAVPLDVVQLISWNGVAEFRDEYWPLCATPTSDTIAGGSIDGAGAWEDEGATLFFELSHALDSNDELVDVSAVSPGFLQLLPFAYGCDATANCGQIAFLARRVFLVPETLIFFSDFESADLVDWSFAVP